VASVELNELWIHDAADLSNYRTLYTSDRSDDTAQSGEVRAYASGRLRVVTRNVQTRTFARTLRRVVPDDLAQLEAWLGVEVMVRDHMSRLDYAVFFNLGVSDWKDRTAFDVAVTFQMVTHPIFV
jgi:hypothetical protein